MAYAITLGLLAVGILLLAVGDRVRLVDPPGTVVIEDRAGHFLGEPGTTRRLGFWPVDPAALPHRVVAATLAIEDHRFWDHPGVDAIGVGRAVVQNVTARRRISGASTIAMQVARLQDPAARTWPNKALEAATALRLIHRYGHATVLAQYLRLAPYGNNVHGIGYAARRYFDKPVADLSWAEVAFICALPQAPGLMNPYRARGRDRAKARAARILDLLRDAGDLDPVDHGQAQRELAVLRVVPRPTRPDATLHPLFAFERRLDALRPTLGTDLRVESTLDLALQTAVQARLRAAIEGEWGEAGAGNAAAVVVDVEADYAVRAAVGSVDWHGEAGALDYSRVRRSAGSTLKPFLYGLGLERGVITPATPIDDLARAGDGIGNNDQRFLGPLLPRVALANSRNVPAVELLERVGEGAFFALLGELGLHRRRFVGGEGLGLAIGGLPVRLVDLVAAYGAIAGDGRRPALRWYARQPEAAPRRIFDESTAAELRLWLADPMARLPSFARGGHLEYPLPVAVKTGTTGDYRDAWVVAITPRYIVGLWVGHPAWRPMRRVSGYQIAAVAREIVLELHPEARSGLGDVGFPPPEGWAPTRICALTGARATPACPASVDEYFAPGAAPEHDCAAHVSLPIDATGALTPGAPTRTFVDLPPRYAAWMRAMGLEPPPGARATGPGLLEERTPRIRIVTPQPGAQLIRDPDAPPEASTLRLQATVDPPAPQVVWYVDGVAVAVADAPYVARWPLAPGAHWIEAGLPYSDVRSPAVRIVAR